MKKTKAKRARGRPRKEGAERYTIRISTDLAAHARKLGDGDMTRGVEIAIQRTQNANERN